MSKRKRHQHGGKSGSSAQKQSETAPTKEENVSETPQKSEKETSQQTLSLPSQTQSHMDTPQKDDSGKTFTVAVIAFIIGFVIAFLIFGGNSTPTTDIPAEGTDPTEEPTEMGSETGTPETPGTTEVPPAGTGGSTEVLPQSNNANVSALNQIFGSTVTAQASTDQTAWVVVYEEAEGAPGKILGAKLIDQGRWEVEVKLLRDTEPEKRYYVKLQADDGDRKFDYTKDLVFTSPLTGKEVMGAFQTTSGTPR